MTTYEKSCIVRVETREAVTTKEMSIVLIVKKALTDKSISIRALAALLGTSEKTAWNKVNSECEFSISEALTVKRELLPEYEMDYLFSDEPASPPVRP